ncbi:MAG: GGDEF domain-containing protein [Acidobacteria bacterium]|nr:GGDEF domain-containing protein [Acidobacteriota bacterium]
MQPEPTPTDTELALSNAYLEALRVTGRCAAEVCPPLGAGVQETLLRLRRRLAFSPQRQALDEAQTVLESTVRDFGRRAKENSDRRRQQTAKLYDLAQRTAELYAARDRSYLELLAEVTRKLQSVATVDNPAEIREHTAKIAMALTQLTETYREDSALSHAELRDELAAFEATRRETEEITTLDPITGAFTRREMEHRIRVALQTDRQFCILKLGVHEFSGFREEHGQPGMNLLMKTAYERLGEQIRPRDVVGQWDPSTFLLLFFDCPLDNAESRAHQISLWLSGEYKLTLAKELVYADVQLTGAATEAQTGESIDAFLERAECLSPVVLIGR